MEIIPISEYIYCPFICTYPIYGKHWEIQRSQSSFAQREIRVRNISIAAGGYIPTRHYPVMQRRYDRDMEIVRRIDAAITKAGEVKP